MRSTWIVALILVLLSSAMAQRRQRTAGGAPPPQSQEAADQAAIQKLQERAIAASANLDVGALLALWTDDGVLLAPGHGPLSGKDKLREFYEHQRDALGNAEILAYEEQWQEVRILGEYAYQWGQVRERTRTGQGKAENSSVLNAMRILKRNKVGDWQIARAVYNQARSGTSLGSEAVPGGERP